MRPEAIQLSISDVPVASVLRVRVGLIYHVALMGDRIVDQERSVLAFSPDAGGLAEQPFSAFARGRIVNVDGYPGKLPPAVVMQRARHLHGKVYSWAEFNCEHFVRYAHDVKVESPQLRQWAFVGGLLGLCALTVGGT